VALTGSAGTVWKVLFALKAGQAVTSWHLSIIQLGALRNATNGQTFVVALTHPISALLELVTCREKPM
jgi:hypothetical protein